MQRFALVVLVACSHPPAAAPPQGVPAPRQAAASAPQPAPSAASWTGCLISKADLDAETGKQDQLAPEGGFVLALMHVERGHAYRAFFGVASDPLAGSSTALSGAMNDSLSEPEGGIETNYEVHGTAASDGRGSLGITLASQQQPHMFDPGSPLAHFAVHVLRITKTDDCK
jgi:hypothetical protein